MEKVILFFAAVICFSTVTNAQKDASLKLMKGQKFQVENKLETSSSTEMQGQAMESKANISSTYHVDVTDKTDKNYNLTNTISHVVMTMSMMGQEVNFDSDKKEDMDGQFGTAFKEYINQPKEVVIDHSGKIITSNSTDTAEATGIAKQLNFEQTGYGAQMAFLALPKNAKAGSQWTDSSNDNGMSRTTHYTIKEIRGNTASITFTGTLSADTKMEQQGMEVSTKTSGTFSGAERVDTKTGVIRSNTSTGEAKGTITAMGQDFPTTSKVTSTTTVTEL